MRNQKFLLPLAIAAAFAASEAKSANFNNLEVPFTKISSPKADSLTIYQLDEFLNGKTGEVKLLVVIDMDRFDFELEWLGIIIRNYPDLIIDLEIAQNIESEFEVSNLNDCKSLRSVKLPETTWILHKNAFRNCVNLESVIMDNVKLKLTDKNDIYGPGECAFVNEVFWGCKHFKSEKSKNIGVINGVEFFYMDDDLTDIEIPGELMNKSFSEINGFKNLKTAKIKTGAEIIGYEELYGRMSPRLVIANCPNIVSIEIEEGLKKFSRILNLPNLEYIKLPESLEYFESITNCPKLKSIKLPSKLKVEEGPMIFPEFEGCSSLESIEIPEGVETIQGNTFINCESLKSIKLPASVTQIEASSDFSSLYGYPFTSPFINCKSLTTFEIPDGITELPDYLFFNCESLKTVKIPSSVTKISSHAFANCKSLEEIKLPENLKEIGDFAFEGCSSLKTIVIPKSVKKVGKGAFWACSSLKNGKDPYKITVGGKIYDYFPENVVCDMFKNSIPDCQFENFTAMKSIDFTNNIKEIGAMVLNGCTMLSSVTFPDNFKAPESPEDEIEGN